MYFSKLLYQHNLSGIIKGRDYRSFKSTCKSTDGVDFLAINMFFIKRRDYRAFKSICKALQIWFNKGIPNLIILWASGLINNIFD